ARCDETKKRNAAVQQLPQAKRQRKRNIRVGSTDSHKLEQDKIEFFSAIDNPLFRVCGSCGEIANSAQATLKLFDPKDVFFLH
ncbi:hypothetical protein PF002_g33089, partial [Phytophthora fragariae]